MVPSTPVPSVPKDLIDLLDKMFPGLPMRSNQDMAEVNFVLGTRKVIETLRQLKAKEDQRSLEAMSPKDPQQQTTNSGA